MAGFGHHGEQRSGPTEGSSNSGEDRISALPDDLLLLVLARLGCARAAARTGLLSRRWLGLWPRLRRIEFRGIALTLLEAALVRFPPPPPAVSLLDISLEVDAAPEGEDHLDDTDRVNSLLRAAARLDPEVLYFDLSSRFGSLVLDLPCFRRATNIGLHLFSDIRCVPAPAGVRFPALENLLLSNCTADVNAMVSRCPRLRRLSLYQVLLPEGDLTVNSPSLEQLVVYPADYTQRVRVVAPVLKQLKMYYLAIQEASISVLAPMLEEVSWDCYFFPPFSAFGLWRLTKLSLKLPSLHIHASIGSSIAGEADSFLQEIERHMIAKFSVLEIQLYPHGHVFGALVLPLLGMNRICATMERLKVTLKRSAVVLRCPSDCPCDVPNWASQTISLTALGEVEISGFEGDEHEIDFLKLIFKYAPMLKRVNVKLSHRSSANNNVRTRISNIFSTYSSVECDVYLTTSGITVHGGDDQAELLNNN